MIVNKLIQIAYQHSTLIDDAEEPQSGEASRGLQLLNSMLRSLNVEDWWSWSRTEVQFLLSGQQEYTIGNYNVGTGTVTSVGPNLYTVEVSNSTQYTAGSFIPVRLKADVQYTNGQTGFNWECDVLSSTGTTVTFGLNDYDLEVGDQVYMMPSGTLPDVVTFAPSDLTMLKYKSGSVWHPVNEVNNATWDSRSETTTNTGYPYKYQFFGNVPYAKVDFGVGTTADLVAKIGYKVKTAEVDYTTELDEILKPECQSALEWMLAEKILATNNRTEPAYIFQEANRLKKQLKRNNSDIKVLNTKRNRVWYDYKSGMNRSC